MRLTIFNCFILLAITTTSFLNGQVANISFVKLEEIGGLANVSGDLADFDFDGDIDVYLSNYVGPSQVWFNDGAGAFSPGEQFGNSLSFKLTVEDFNNDGSPDVFVPSNGSPAQFWINDGMGLFDASPQTVNAFTGEAAAGDIDDDGDVDMFITWQANVEDSVAFNNGDGTFEFPGGGGSSGFRFVALGDLDGDNDLDAFLAHGGIANPRPHQVLFNNGNGAFELSTQMFGPEFGSDVALADLDSDGDLDAFVTNLAINNAPVSEAVWLNDGSGIFTDSGQIISDGGAQDVELADIEPDGDIDALVIGQDFTQRVYLNNGQGVFDQSIVVSAISDSSQGLLGDVDNDGDMDVIVIAFSGTRVFLTETNFPLGDLNHDGVVNLLDVSLFVDALNSGNFVEEADINQDGELNLLDVAPFISLIA